MVMHNVGDWLFQPVAPTVGKDADHAVI